MRLSISEILNKVSEIPSKKEKIEYLQKNQSRQLLDILRYAYDDRIKFLLPEGAVPYKPCPFPGQEASLYQESRRLYLFVEGGNPNLKQMKRELLFIQLLEMLDPNDAKLIVAVKDKKLPYKGVNKKLIEEAFPGLVNEQI